MKKIALGLVFFLAITLHSFAQEKTLTESITHYLNINGTKEQYNHAVTSLVDMLKKQYASKNVPGNVWEELNAEKPKAINQIKAMLASAYRSHFDKTEINEMIEFYESPTGRQMVKDQTQLSQEDRDNMAKFYNTETGKKILDKSDSLNKMVSEISESWSRNLYVEMTDKLAAKGYAL